MKALFDFINSKRDIIGTSISGVSMLLLWAMVKPLIKTFWTEMYHYLTNDYFYFGLVFILFILINPYVIKLVTLIYYEFYIHARKKW